MCFRNAAEQPNKREMPVSYKEKLKMAIQQLSVKLTHREKINCLYAWYDIA
jgi:hypothetical protein